MDYMVHFIDFISWGVFDNGLLYCITLCLQTSSNNIVNIKYSMIVSNYKAGFLNFSGEKWFAMLFYAQRRIVQSPSCRRASVVQSAMSTTAAPA
jgi:hypothetical protein